MHVIAYCYHWDRDVLWNITRSERRMWVNKILLQKKSENDEIENVDTKNPPQSPKYLES